MFFSFHQTWGKDNFKPVNLRCEYLTNPIGVDVKHPRFSWQVKIPSRGFDQSAYRILVSDDSLNLTNNQGDYWDSEKLNSPTSNGIQYKGKELDSRQKYYWKVIVWDDQEQSPVHSSIANFETGIFDLHEWQGDWVSDGEGIEYEPAPYFRKEFKANGEIAKARLYICGLGYYVLHLNGQKVGRQKLAPAYSRYDKTSYYNTYDITSLINAGNNAIGVILGNGWYNEQSKAVWYFHEAPWRARPKLLFNLYIEYKDGSERMVSSDTTWKVTHGPITFNNIYSGEYHDARKEMPGWDVAGYDDSQWQSASLPEEQNAGKLKSQLMQPIRVKKELTPVSVTKFNDTSYLFDMGQNFAGFSRISASGKKGTTLTLKHGEKLDEEGHIDNTHIGKYYRFEDTTEQAQTDRLILSGDDTDIFTQHFTYHGYRYIEVTSDRPVHLDKTSIKGLVAHTDTRRIGRFSTSSDLMNQIFDAGIWSYISNMHGIPTDCPHREKNGWTGDGHISTEIGLYNFDAILFYEKWLRDYIDEQRPTGELPGIIPTSGWGYQWGNGPSGDSGLLLIPWYIYLYYGDDYLIQKYYKQFKKYINFLSFRGKEYLQYFGFGDRWTPDNKKTPASFTSSCYYFTDARLMAKYAKITGHTDDVNYYNKLADSIKKAINNKFYNPETKTYANGSQTALNAALYHGIVPESLKEQVTNNLEARFHSNNNHLNVGFLGSKYLKNALTNNGLTDLAYKVASQDTKPSWGWWIRQGLTTFQESWGIGPSRNHPFKGEILAWMYKALAGIKPDPEDPGFKSIIIKPHFVNGLSHVKASYNSVNGLIVSEWQKNKHEISLNITIPPNSQAKVYLPKKENKKIYERNKPINRSNHYIRLLKTTDNYKIFMVDSGYYEFELK